MVYRDLHALDPSSMTWYQGPEGSGSPSARYGHSATLVGGSKMLIFGGTDGKNYFNDLYVLDLEIMAWTQPKTSGNFVLGKNKQCRACSKPKNGTYCYANWY